jgi:hypothetical protein
MMVSWFPAAALERVALRQPDHPIGAYTQPLSVKGTVRYVTATQKRWYEAARTAFWLGWVIGCPALIFVLAWDRRRARNSLNRLLQSP